MDENETIQDDEGTVRCNFLNIRPSVVEAEVVEDEQQSEDLAKKQLSTPTNKKDRRWLFLLLFAIVLALVFYAWVNLGADEDNNKNQPEQWQGISL